MPGNKPPWKEDVKDVVAPDEGGVALTVTVYSNAVADISAQLTVALLVVIPVAFSPPGASQAGGINEYTCPDTGFIVIVFVAVTELTTGDALLLFNDKKLPLPVVAPVMPIDAPPL